jgi:hypothetical protein
VFEEERDSETLMLRMCLGGKKVRENKKRKLENMGD